MRPSRFVHRNKSNQSKDTNIRHSRFVPVFLHQLVVGRSRPSVSAINHTSVSDSSGPPAPNEQATDTAQSRRFSALTDSLSHFALFSLAPCPSHTLPSGRLSCRSAAPSLWGVSASASFGFTSLITTLYRGRWCAPARPHDGIGGRSRGAEIYT